MNKDPFKEYKESSNPEIAQKAYAWSTAIGLQAVDGLKTSEYLIEIAIKNIKGEITFKEVEELIENYHKAN